MTAHPAKARYIMIGGFLGAGKSTALGKLARRLTVRGLRVGLITNDQGSDLVDSATLRAQGFPVEEIAGGCFCCRFNSLVAAARSLSREERPDVFLAEPVGSCTDLVATVSYPLRRIYGEEFSIAPLSVLVDPIRAARVLGLAAGRSFSRKVVYVYEKQLEEADCIAINKCDLIEASDRAALRAALERRFPRAECFEVSLREGFGLEEWFGRIETEEMRESEVMQVDYDLYAEGEALLGWLNATLDLSSEADVDASEVLHALAGGIQKRLALAGAEVAHLKITLSPEGDPFGAVAVVNLVRQDYVPEVCQELAQPVRKGQLIVNLRAEAEPEALRRAVEEEVGALSAGTGGIPPLAIRIEHMESFRPGRPVPTHRVGT